MNSTDILTRAFGYGTDLSTVTLAEIEDAFVDAGYSKEDAEEEAAHQDGRILPNKIRIHRNR